MESKPKPPVIIDTSVLLTDPYILNNITDRKILVPIAILKELDLVKKGVSLKNRNARESIRILEKQRKLEKHKRQVDFMSTDQYPKDLSVDDVIVHIAKVTGAKIISNDINLRVNATCFGIEAEDYKPNKYLEKTVTSNQCKGYTFLRKNPFGRAKNLRKTPNHYFVYKDKNRNKICKFNNKNDLVSINYSKIDLVETISALNVYQQMAMDALLDKELSLVSLVGGAGTGKTLLALACGISQCRSSHSPVYNSISVGRAIVPLGRDMGALPGDVEDKIRPYLSPLYDNLEVLAEANGDPYDQSYSNNLFNSGLLSIQAFAFMRGRSINKRFIIIDEAQNLTLHEAKTILTRAGKGTKIVLVGDPDQIDVPDLNSENNGLSYITQSFVGQPCFATVTLDKVERSDLADLAVRILK
jgi:PhoH-like ATPase